MNSIKNFLELPLDKQCEEIQYFSIICGLSFHNFLFFNTAINLIMKKVFIGLTLFSS